VPAFKIGLRPLRRADCDRMGAWFADADTNRWLGGAEWPLEVLALCDPASGRFAYAAVSGDELVGLVDVECYADRRASMAIVVAPGLRRQGVGRKILDQVLEQPDLAHILEFFGGVEVGNIASQRLITAAGFLAMQDGPDEEGFTYYARRRDETLLKEPQHVEVERANKSAVDPARSATARPVAPACGWDGSAS
jgi:RimJ/RimL family protein N-acetyltransferase